MVIYMKRSSSLLITVIFILLLLLCACGGNSNGSTIPDEMVGTWDDGKTYSTFPISEIEIGSDGTMTIYMDHTYTGKISGSNGKYKINVEEGAGSAVAGVTVDEVKKGLNITAELNSDNTLTVYVKAKSGYVYYGPESEIFTKT